MAPGAAAGIPGQDSMGGMGLEKQGDDLIGTKTNSETLAVVDTNHEGVIVSITSSTLSHII